MADRIGNLGVLDELRAAGRARGEVQQQPVPGCRARMRRRGSRRGVRLAQVVPPVGSGAHHDPLVVARDIDQLRTVGWVGDHEPGIGPCDTVGEICRSDRGGGRHHHRAELDHREHAVPQLDLVAQHEKHTVSAPDTELGQPGRDLVGAPGHVVERVRRAFAALLGQDQRRTVVAASKGVEPVDSPVELRSDIRPRERLGGLGVIGARCQKEVTRRL